MNTITFTCYDAPALQLPCAAPKRTLAKAIGKLTAGHPVDSPLDDSATNRAFASFLDMDAEQICEQMRDQTAPIHEQFERFIWMLIHESRNT